MSSPCNDPACPVIQPKPGWVSSTRTTVLPLDDRWWRAVKDPYRADDLVPGVGNTRFAPLASHQHAYVGRTRTVSLLETVLHDVAGPTPRMFRADLEHWQISAVTLRRPLRVIDLRNPELERLGIGRDHLVDTTAKHYQCTRSVAAHLARRKPGGHTVNGIIWHSRQADVHARANPDGLIGDVLHHDPIEVAVIWCPTGTPSPLSTTGPPERLVNVGQPTRLINELSVVLNVPII